MIYSDIKSGFIIGDSSDTNLTGPGVSVPEPERVMENLKEMILSASGWRKIFSFENGSSSNPQSMSEMISPADSYIIAGASYIFGKYIIQKSGKISPSISVGLDSRPTGPSIGSAAVKILLSMGIKVRYHFIVSAPEIMAYVKNEKDIDGFIYFSASHNPAGYNGIKFGPGTGAVLGGEESSLIIKNYLDFMKKEDTIPFLSSLTEQLDEEILNKTYYDIKKWKSFSYKAYLDFNKSIFTHEGRFSPGAEKINIGIVADLNGSARAVSIDYDFFTGIGIKSLFFNDIPGKIVHEILPEGKNLDFCRRKLEEQYKKDSTFLLGYMPDNDGDRGNLVYIDTETAKAEVLNAQEVFALACVSELSFMVYTGVLNYDSSGNLKEKCAVVVNGPTSTRIERICRPFGVSVFRSEVGEANVVNLSKRLMDEGWIVRIIGEGSNGGNITYPATVRDPMNTVGSIIKLLTVKTETIKGEIIPGLLDIWLEKIYRHNFIASDNPSDSDYSDKERHNFIASDNPSDSDYSDKERRDETSSIGYIIKTLPRFTTTATDDSDAKMEIQTDDHGVLKNNYEKIFSADWEIKKQYLLENYGIAAWKEVNYMRTEAAEGTGSEIRGSYTNGGLKIIFIRSDGEDAGFIWMRGSGTEPVFRVMADIEGGETEKEKYLLNWHRDMIRRADNLQG